MRDLFKIKNSEISYFNDNWQATWSSYQILSQRAKDWLEICHAENPNHIPLSVNSWPSYCIGRCNTGVTRAGDRRARSEIGWYWYLDMYLCILKIFTLFSIFVWYDQHQVIQNHISNSNTFYCWWTIALISWFEIQFKYLTWYHLIRSGIKADRASGEMYLEG